MAEKKKKAQGRDWSQTLFLPQTDFPMRAGLPQKEPELLARWAKIDLYHKLREAAKGRDKFILHDGPPYANGNIHIGHALNKILKDVVTRAQQMQGYDSNYVPGWDCHGLPIEWKVEEENYRAKGKPKPELTNAKAMIAFRLECRAYAEHWLNVQREEFKRLGVEGDWENYYSTMDFAAEAQIAREVMKFAANDTLYRGSKPVMWSVVEKTALAEAEVEYEDYTSDQVWVRFPVVQVSDTPEAPANIEFLQKASVVIWTTTPWTLPGNRAISYSPKISYGLYRVEAAPADNWASEGSLLVLSDNLAESVKVAAKIERLSRLSDVKPGYPWGIGTCAHPLREKIPGYQFDVPLLAGDHVTDDVGTGFVHTAPGHGREDFEVWTANAARLERRGINTTIPYTVDENGAFTEQAPGFTGKRVINDKGEKGDANEAVIKALVEAGMIIARSRLKHQYPHSWRSKKPVIFRNTPQWFVAMDKPFSLPLPKGERSDAQRPGEGARTTDRTVPPHPLASLATSPHRGEVDMTLRNRALKAINETRWVPPAGQNRITGMIESKPDWVLSRQRAWGVPIAVFVKERGGGSVEVLKDDKVNARIAEAFEEEGADAWYKDGARERFLGKLANEPWQKVDDILDVWFESGSTHAFTLEVRDDLKAERKRDGGPDAVMYLEGSDQHRGWFHSSLLESCGTRGHAPFDIVLTHGFVLDEEGRKMSKSLGNVVAPQDVIKNSGADILRLWVCASDYADDLRIGPEILKTTVETYRKLRNTLRWMLGNLAHFSEDDRIDVKKMPELERLMLHRLTELDALVRRAYGEFDYKRIFASLNAFMTVDLSAFYFDVRKDALYCDPIDSTTRRAALTVIDQLFSCLTVWLAPLLCFTMEEAWLARRPSSDGSVHLEQFPDVPEEWRDDRLARKWQKIRQVRRVVTGALEIERAAKRIGSSLEAAPEIYIADKDLRKAIDGADLAEISITSGASLKDGEGPKTAFRLEEVAGVAVVPQLAKGRKCARSWKISEEVGHDPDFPELTSRDAEAVRQFDALHK